MTLHPPPAPDEATLQAAIADAHRLAALRATQLLDTPAEESFDRLTRLATELIGAPASFMTLVDTSRDFYKSMSGPGEPLASSRQWVGPTFCHFLLTTGGPLVLDDVTAYPGYNELPTIETLGLRAYAGAPLMTSDGRCLGSFCVVDFAPRHWRSQDVALLTELAASAMREIELRQALRMAAESAQAKGSFLSNMSHEIRTPMNAIIGLTHLMARQSQDPVLSDRLAKVDAAAQHLLHILNDILDLSKIEAGKMPLEDAPFALDDLLSGSIDMVRPRAQEKGLELLLDTDHLPRRVHGDITRLRQALLNLLTNAVKFTAQGWVRLSGELIGQDAERVQLRFEVRDTGEGIPEAAQARLFRNFEQADQSVSRRHGGTGLGLALTRHLAQLMGGEVGVHSVPGQGSRFWLTAWLGRLDDGDMDPAASPLPGGLRVLVVDDLPEARASLSDQLRMLGLDPHAVASGPQAVAAVQQAQSQGQPFDLMLVDWQMKPMDGLSTLQAVSVLTAQHPPHALLVSAHDEPGLRQRARECGFDDLLVKPVAPSRLHDALVQALGTPLPSPEPLPAARHSPAEMALRAAHSGRRVLLAEDNPVNQDVASELLKMAGLAVDVASDGLAAVAMAESAAYDVVLLDMQMPGLGGLAVARRLRETLGRQLPLIAMTANAFGDDRRACLDAGMNDHVSKPVHAETLYRTLLRWLPGAGSTDALPD